MSSLASPMHAFFHPAEPTADIGCGSGRDTAWLAGQGFPTVGYDAAPAMLRAARSAHPQMEVREASLPDLAAIEDGRFGNVLCSAVLMHVGREHLITAVMNLARILRAGGRLLISFRPSRGSDDREADGRLFTSIPTGKLILLLESAGLQVLQTESQPDGTRPDVQWTVILAEKSPLQVSRGLERVQAVLAQDRKDATYKFALLRALCQISRTQPNVVRWGNAHVYVPLWSVAVQWLVYYWPFVASAEFVAQKRGERPESAKRIAFRREIEQLAGTYGQSGLYALLRSIDENPRVYSEALKRIAKQPLRRS